MWLAILALTAAATPADEHRREVERAVFELCPQAIAGSLSLADAAQVSAAGYTATEPRQTPGGPAARAVRGSGTDQIVIAANRNDSSATCTVWFGGPNNRRLFRAVRQRVQESGFAGGNAGQLGDGTRMHLFRRGGDQPTTMVIFDADAGGELNFEPATTVILMTGN